MNTNYFEHVSLWDYQYVDDNIPKHIQRINVDMGIGTFISFAINEITLFGYKFGYSKKANEKEFKKILDLTQTLRRLMENSDKFYTIKDMINKLDPEALSALSVQEYLRSYTPEYWKKLEEDIRSNFVPDTES